MVSSYRGNLSLPNIIDFITLTAKKVFFVNEQNLRILLAYILLYFYFFEVFKLNDLNNYNEIK